MFSGMRTVSPACAAIAPFAQDHLTRVDVIVNGMELRGGVKSRARHDLDSHALAAAQRETLADVNVVQVVIHVPGRTASRDRRVHRARSHRSARQAPSTHPGSRNDDRTPCRRR